MIDYNEVSAVETQISSRVRNFKRIGDTNWNYSCDVCGDSVTNSRKARFFVGQDKKSGTLMVHCHNCGYSASFKNYCEYKHPDVHKELNQKKFFSDNTLYDIDSIINKIDSEEVLVKLFFIDRFKDTNQWVGCLRDRKIKVNKNNFKKLLLLYRQFHQLAK